LYKDQETAQACTNIDWDSISTQSSTTRTIYVKNTGNITETLHMTTSDWTPTEVSSMLSLAWDKESFSLASGEVVAATLTLTMGQDTGTVDSFDFNTIIEGTS
jgi:hypothetical protein